jgi:hypothetical protein
VASTRSAIVLALARQQYQTDSQPSVGTTLPVVARKPFVFEIHTPAR